MRFMNYWDIESAVNRFDPNVTPNRARLAQVIDRLADWTNHNSDGWAYWRKPVNAARRAMELVDGGTTAERIEQEETDATDAETKAALVPIRAFLTRQGVPHDTIIPEGVQLATF